MSTTPRPTQVGRRGMSLVELLLSLTILALIMGAMTSFVLLSTRALPMHETSAGVRLEGQKFLSTIAEDVRWSRTIWTNEDPVEDAGELHLRIRSGGVQVAFEVASRDGDSEPDFVLLQRTGSTLLRYLLLSTTRTIPSPSAFSTMDLWVDAIDDAWMPAGSFDTGVDDESIDLRMRTGDRTGMALEPEVDIRGREFDAQVPNREHLLAFARGGARENVGGAEQVVHVGPIDQSDRAKRLLVALMPALPAPMERMDNTTPFLWSVTEASLYMKRSWVMAGNVPQYCSARFAVRAYIEDIEDVLENDPRLDRPVGAPATVANCMLRCGGNTFDNGVQKLDLTFVRQPTIMVPVQPCTNSDFPFQATAPLRGAGFPAFSPSPNGGLGLPADAEATWLRHDQCLLIDVRLPEAGDLGFVSYGGQGGCASQYPDALPAIAFLASPGAGSDQLVLLSRDAGNTWTQGEIGVAFDLWGYMRRPTTSVLAGEDLGVDTLAGVTLSVPIRIDTAVERQLISVRPALATTRVAEVSGPDAPNGDID